MANNKTPKKDIKRFIDFFSDATFRIRKQKPTITRGKDGALVQRSLILFSRPQIEMMAVWFLAKKPKLSPTIGALLSVAVLDELSKQIRRPAFWKELDMLSSRYFPRRSNSLPLLPTRSKQEFSAHDVQKLKKLL